jgi:intracellular sulfur oxidation DsrE/DsrF family protein
MKYPAPALLAAAWLAGCAVAPQASTPAGGPDNRAALAGVRDMRMAFDFTDGNPKVLLAKLNTVDVTRKQLIDDGVTPHIVLSFRGDASYYTQSDADKVKPEDRDDARKVTAKIKELRTATGVESLEQCNLPLAQRKLKANEVIPEVKVVGNGWISLVAYQQRGYAYIAP